MKVFLDFDLVKFINHVKWGRRREEGEEVKV